MGAGVAGTATILFDKLRYDVHCASAAQAQTINTYPGVKLAVGNCFLRKEVQNPALKQNYEHKFELD